MRHGGLEGRVPELATPLWTEGGLVASMGTGPHPPASHHAHILGTLPAFTSPSFWPVELWAPLPLFPGASHPGGGGTFWV